MKEVTVTAASKLTTNWSDGDNASVTIATNDELFSDADEIEAFIIATLWAAFAGSTGAYVDKFVDPTTQLTVAKTVEATADSSTGAVRKIDKSSSTTTTKKTHK